MVEDTIAAICTAVGGAIGVIRLSGPEALEVALKVWSPVGSALTAEGEETLKPRYMYLGHCSDGSNDEEQALMVYMPGPNSYTGENTVEIQCHGGAFSTRVVLARILEGGARHADPGEFTRRAFINGKMDLTQAEAVIDIIHSHSEMALHTANRQLNGVMGRKTNGLYETVKEILAEVEVRMDFVDEDLDWESHGSMREKLYGLRDEIVAMSRSKNEGEVLRHGIKIVLAGAPNAGKSSLMNLFLGRDRAIVTEIPGTTRDVLEEFAHVRGIPVRLFDTAGIRESKDLVEKIGVDRSKDYLREAQIILWLVDATCAETEDSLPEEFRYHENMIVVRNKIDCEEALPLPFATKSQVISTSTVTGEGYNELLNGIETMVWKYPHSEEVDIAINTRHADLLDKALVELEMAEGAIETEEWELVAISLRGLLHNLGSITGQSVSPDILDNIFAKFCIGK